MASIHKTVPQGMAQIIVADDASGPEHLAALRAIEGIEVVAGEQNSGLRRERQPRPARGRPGPRRGRAQLRHGGAAGLAGLPAVRGQPRGRRRRSWARGCCTPTGASSSPAPFATSTRRSGSTTATGSSPTDWGPAALPGARARGDRGVHVCAPRGDRADRPARRALPDGLRGRRLVPARVAGGVARDLLPRARASSTTSRSRAAPRWASASASPSACSGSAGGTSSMRATCARPTGKLRVVYVTEGTGVGGGSPGHLRAPQPPGRARPRGVRCTRSGSSPTGSSCACRCTASTSMTNWSTSSPSSTRSRWRRGGTPRCPCGARACCEASLCTSSRTSRRPTTPTTSRCRHAVIDSYRPEFRYMTISGWNRERLRELGLDAELIPPGIDLDTFRPRAEVDAPR